MIQVEKLMEEGVFICLMPSIFTKIDQLESLRSSLRTKIVGRQGGLVDKALGCVMFLRVKYEGMGKKHRSGGRGRVSILT